MATLRIVVIVVTASLVPPRGIDAQLDRVNRQAAETTQKAAVDCAGFQSPGRLPAGTAFRAPLVRGLEFRLSADWDISVGPVNEPMMDYLWVVSPPLRTAPHRMIGAGYGLTARESARINRPLRFVVTRAQYTAARAAIDLESAAETLKRLDQLGVGRLSLTITDFQIRDIRLPDGRHGDAFEWITFKGEACVPKQAAG